MVVELLIAYTLRIVPGVLAGIFFVALLPRKSIELRIASYILLFVLIRDAMTPLGLWSFGTEGFFWMRFIGDPWIMIILGVLSGLLVLAVYLLDSDTRQYIVLLRAHYLKAIPAGIVGAIVIAAPLLAVYTAFPIEARGGSVPAALMVPILVMALFGNFLEEALFRGYLQGYMDTVTSRPRSALLSGVMFCFGHVFLATTVTDVGVSVLVFTLYEGVIAAFVQMRYGLIPATLAHGGAIFLIASGIIV